MRNAEEKAGGRKKGWAFMLMVLNLKVTWTSIQVSYMLMYLNKPRKQRMYKKKQTHKK